jgi:hypothetical protein
VLGLGIIENDSLLSVLCGVLENGVKLLKR